MNYMCQSKKVPLTCTVSNKIYVWGLANFRKRTIKSQKCTQGSTEKLNIRDFDHMNKP